MNNYRSSVEKDIVSTISNIVGRAVTLLPTCVCATIEIFWSCFRNFITSLKFQRNEGVSIFLWNLCLGHQMWGRSSVKSGLFNRILLAYERWSRYLAQGRIPWNIGRSCTVNLPVYFLPLQILLKVISLCTVDILRLLGARLHFSLILASFRLCCFVAGIRMCNSTESFATLHKYFLGLMRQVACRCHWDELICFFMTWCGPVLALYDASLF